MAGRQCNSDQYCNAGTCACRPGLTLSGGRCVNFQTDGNNCGRAGNVCPMNRVCLNGNCQNNCTGGTTGVTRCGQSCVNWSNDPLNCGGCGSRCDANEVCVRGACRPYTARAGCTTCPCTACFNPLSNCCTYPGTMTRVCVDSLACP
jgi:hypothetical protein